MNTLGAGKGQVGGPVPKPPIDDSPELRDSEYISKCNLIKLVSLSPLSL